MTLLAPISAVVAAALAVPALLLFYFLKLKRRPVRVSSTMLWEDAAHDLQVNVPLRWLRASWMLLLQLLALALLILALGRPAMGMDGAPGNRLVIVIDRSASMNARDETGITRLDRAVSRARELMRTARRDGLQVMLIAFSGSAAALTGFTSDSTELAAALSAIEPGDGVGSLTAALSVVAAAGANIISESAAPASTEVVLLSDGVFDDVDPPHVPNARVRFESMASTDGSDTGNIAVDALTVSRDPNQPGVARAFVRLISTLDAPATVTMTMTLANELVERRVVEVPPRAGGEVGEASLTVRINDFAGGLLRVGLDQGGALAADDHAAAVLPSALRPRVLLVEPDGQSAGQNDAWLIQGVLDELPLSESVLVSESTASAMQRDGRMGRYALVIYDRVAPARMPPVPTLSFGAALPIKGLSSAPVADPTRVLSWRRTDPVLRDVSLDALIIAQTLALTMDDSAETVMTPLARGSDGPLIARFEDAGQTAHPRLLVAFDLSQSTWPLTPGFAIFLSNAVETMALGGGGEGAAFTTSEPAHVRVPSGWSRVEINGPAQMQFNSADRAAPGPRVALGVLERAGVYAVMADGSDAGSVAVNLASRTESTLGSVNELEIGGERLVSTGGGDAPREIWHWFLLAALLVLALEWLLNAMLMRA